MLVLKDGRIKFIVEIEESNVKPTQICGKFLTSALSKYYIHVDFDDEPVLMGKDVVFIQVVDTRNLKEKTRKHEQWMEIEKSINNILPLKETKITQYKLYTTDELPKLKDFIKKTTK